MTREVSRAVSPECGRNERLQGVLCSGWLG